MRNITLDNDYFSRKLTKYFIFLQIGAMLFVFVLIAFQLYSFALAISFITSLAFVSILVWLWLRFQQIPAVKEKHSLLQKTSQLQKNILEEEKTIKAVKQKRESLLQAEQKEIGTALLDLQQKYIQKGLSSSYIKDAVINGVGPKLKERLAMTGIVTAANVSSDRIAQIPGFGEAKRSAVVSWQAGVYGQLGRTKPTQLPGEQLENIQQKYQTWQNQNDANEQSAEHNRQKLEENLCSLEPRLKQLASLTFTTYLGKSLAPKGYIALFNAFVLIATQAISGLSATTSAIIASIPAATVTPTITLTSTNTLTPTVSFTPIITDTPTITFTPIATNTPTITFTPLSTPTIAHMAAGASCIPNNPPQTGKVVDVVDGDTIKVLLDQNGQTYTVRYIGMDTPESTTKIEYFGPEAATKNVQLVFGKNATLIRDVSETDRYERLLRYVIVDNLFINYELVARGYANTASYPPDIACIPTFQAAEKKARAANLGFWNVPPTLAALPTLAPAPSGGGGGNAVCNCGGPDLDCGDFRPRSSAQACFDYCVSQGYGDVFKLDRDNDGLACEG